MSLAKSVKKSKFLSGLLTPIAIGYSNLSGYKKLGLKYDDLLVEENAIAKESLRRLEANNPEESNKRAYRLRTAQQLSIQHAILPKSQWTKKDDRYLSPIIDEVTVEAAERDAFNNVKIVSKK